QALFLITERTASSFAFGTAPSQELRYRSPVDFSHFPEYRQAYPNKGFPTLLSPIYAPFPGNCIENNLENGYQVLG
ncbi:MAG: hypothetical protein U9Q07_02860, partial [Planctomycetota bacterium]|nr:hypothetical protein [Planctomycetota bacterium]